MSHNWQEKALIMCSNQYGTISLLNRVLQEFEDQFIKLDTLFYTIQAYIVVLINKNALLSATGDIKKS